MKEWFNPLPALGIAFSWMFPTYTVIYTVKDKYVIFFLTHNKHKQQQQKKNNLTCLILFFFLFSNVYLQVKAISNIVWKYQRYHFIMAYHEKPVLPPPLIILSHMASLFCCICKRRKTDKTSDGPSMNSYYPKNYNNFLIWLKQTVRKVQTSWF